MIELKGSPVASAPIFASTSSGLYWFIVRMAVGTFDTDSMPNLEFRVACGDNLSVGQTDGDAEQVGRYVGQIGYIVGVFTS